MGDVDGDRSVPALIVKVGSYPVPAGGLGVARSLGRLGIPVHVITEDPVTPLALSRYRARRFGWHTTGLENAEVLVRGLAELGRRIGTRSVAIATDDEAAILLAEHADALSEYFLLPAVEPGLYRQLASKHALFRLCREHNVPTPETAVLSNRAELLAYAREATFPLVVKNADPWVRLRAPMVGATRVIRSQPELLAIAESGHETFRLLVQEHLPVEHAEDWFVHAYFDANSEPLVSFAGVKVRAWPVGGGVTACGYSVPNPELSALAERFCKATGFQGIADLDWRLDRRDGQYKLVDFNPRVGAQFALFQTTRGIDVVRAMHLDLTGRSVPTGEQVNGRRFVVEPFDLMARLVGRKAGTANPAPPPPRDVRGGTVFGFAALDDPLPFLAVWPRLARSVLVRHLRNAWLALPLRRLSGSRPGARHGHEGR
jgi:predicted ATP-grasp superfamily ATP-dependent carboligase